MTNSDKVQLDAILEGASDAEQKAAEKLVEHLVSVGATKREITVVHNGQHYLVSVAVSPSGEILM